MLSPGLPGIFFDTISRDAAGDLGTFFHGGENGTGAEYRTICRSMVIDPRDGASYFSTGEGTIHRLRLKSKAVKTVAPETTCAKILRHLRPGVPRPYGIQLASGLLERRRQPNLRRPRELGYLFRFDPSLERVEVLDRITSSPSKLSGMYDAFSFTDISVLRSVLMGARFTIDRRTRV